MGERKFRASRSSSDVEIIIPFLALSQGPSSVRVRVRPSQLRERANELTMTHLGEEEEKYADGEAAGLRE